MSQKSQYTWTKRATRSSKPKVPEDDKKLITETIDQLIEAKFKPTYVKEKPKDHEYNYLVDIYSKWYRNYIYICGTYNCPSPRAISPSFEAKFTRLEYLGKDTFALSYMRHTEQWCEVETGLSLNNCIEMIGTTTIFHPT